MNDLISENKVIASILLIMITMLVRWLVIRQLKRRPKDEDQIPKRWISRVKNATVLLITVGLVVIWLFELRYFALSIAAFAVALVIAIREYIQSVLGSMYQSATKMFVIGDWIEIGIYCGEVVSNDWLTTTLLEVDMESASYCYTGKTLIIPNNLFVSNTVTNLNFMRRYINHTFCIVRDADQVNVVSAKSLILEKAVEYCMPFSDVAQRYSSMIESRLDVTIGGPEPSVRIGTNSLGKNQFEVTIFCPTHEEVTIEQRLIEDFMLFWYAQVDEHSAKKAANNTIVTG
ncbi:MAG: small-conductance mechanosensitive channel [Alteromonadaceae bacterium]|jgi:small-conductance mechanosensitive channel